MSYTKIENMFQNLSPSLCVSVYTHSPRRETETDLTRIFRNVYYANLANVYYFGQNLAHHDFFRRVKFRLFFIVVFDSRGTLVYNKKIAKI